MLLEVVVALLQLAAFVDWVLTLVVFAAVLGVLTTAVGVVGIVRARREASC